MMEKVARVARVDRFESTNKVEPISRFITDEGVSGNRGEYWLRVKEFLDGFSAKDKIEVTRRLALGDLFFWFVVVLNRSDGDNDFVFNLCRELEKRYRRDRLDNVLHLYARGHYKSSLITMALTMRELCEDSERTFCIFSHTRDAAKKFMNQIKREFEVNEYLKELFSDVVWGDAEKESPRWSLNDGIVLKRKGNPKEGSVEAWGVVDRQPTGRHFSDMIYDDLVTLESVSTPEQIEKTTQGWRLSLNLDNPTVKSVKRYIGTRYHYADTYKVMMDSGIECIIKTATVDGRIDGEPVFLSREQLDDKISKMGEVVAAAQLFLNPMQVSTRGFRIEWLKYYDTMPDINTMNRYILVDPANTKGKKSDYTVIQVWGLGIDRNYYLLYGIRDKLGLKERKDRLFELVRRYNPNMVAYEEYGMQSDIEYLNESMDKENFRFNITKMGGRIKKQDRIDTFVPVFEAGRVWFPRSCYYDALVSGSGLTEGKRGVRDFVKEFIEEEFSFYPFVKHDDMLDCASRLTGDGSVFLFQFPYNPDYVGDSGLVGMNVSSGIWVNGSKIAMDGEYRISDSGSGKGVGVNGGASGGVSGGWAGGSFINRILNNRFGGRR